jgi:AcrR family transcriptional regulator
VRKRDTRKQLILAAEQLFAARGIEGVSLREINLAAQQRNTSAAHYHFGSKDALVDAIFEFRRAEVGARRDQLLDALESDPNAVTPFSLAEALILPLAQEIPETQGAESGRYLEFLAHLMLTAPAQTGDILRKYESADSRWLGVAIAALPHLPRRILEMRRYLMGRHVVVSLAAFQRRGLGTASPVYAAYLSDMVDAVAGYLSAVPSERTLSLSREREEARAEGAAASILPVAPVVQAPVPVQARAGSKAQ